MRGLGGSAAGSTVGGTLASGKRLAAGAKQGRGASAQLSGFCGSPGLSESGLQPVPWFRENALLKVDGRGGVAAEDGAGCAAGEERGA